MARVVLKNLTKCFREVVAVNKLSLEVQDKELVVLLGPSGSGKTTALRCIAGLESPDDGEIYIDDRCVNDLEPKERDVAMVFQSYALYPHMTVYQNIAFPLECAKVSERETRNRVRRVARLLKIEGLLTRKPRQISGGQQQRVALGRAIVREPKVFLMDEPLSNLDAKLRVYMRAELKRLQKELGVTTIYVTHDQVEAMTMADRVAILNEGVLQQFDPPNHIYMKPLNVFVAGFIGSPPTNLFDCTLTDEDLLDAGEFRYPLPKDLAATTARSATSNELMLGIRPGHIQVHRNSKANHIRANLYTTEPLGETLILNLKVGENIVKAMVSPDFEIAEELWIEFPTNKILLFDKKTGKSLV